jgi:hypothetical protein
LSPESGRDGWFWENELWWNSVEDTGAPWQKKSPRKHPRNLLRLKSGSYDFGNRTPLTPDPGISSAAKALVFALPHRLHDLFGHKVRCRAASRDFTPRFRAADYASRSFPAIAFGSTKRSVKLPSALSLIVIYVRVSVFAMFDIAIRRTRQIDKPAPSDSEGVVTSRKHSPISHGSRMAV